MLRVAATMYAPGDYKPAGGSAPPPRSSPRKGKRPVAPVLKAGQRQVIPEPAVIMGRSGKVYSTLAEEGGEMVTIVPLRRPFAPKFERGAQRAVTGDELLALGGGPDAGSVNDPNSLAYKVAHGQITYGTPTSMVQPPAIRPQVIGGANLAGGLPVTAVGATAGPSPGSYGAGGQSAYAAEQQRLQADQDVINANRGVTPALTSQLAARRAASGASLSYLDAQTSANAATRADLEAIQAAARNDPDKFAIAQSRRARSSEDYRYDVAGLGLPEEVVVSGTSMNLPPGVRPKLETQEQLLRRDAESRQALQAVQLDLSRIGAARAGNAADLAGLDVEGAELGVRNAGLAANQARLGEQQAKTAPFAGAVFDDFSGNWITPQAAQVAAAQRGLVVDPVSNSFVTRQDLMARTDSHGNVLGPDGVWVDPSSGEQGRPATYNRYVNGVWTDPRSGNVYGSDPQTGAPTWVSPQGLVLRNGLWWDLGFGGYLREDGSLYNPQTGQVRYGGAGYLTGGGFLNQTIGVIDARNRVQAPAYGAPGADDW